MVKFIKTVIAAPFILMGILCLMIPFALFARDDDQVFGDFLHEQLHNSADRLTGRPK